MPKLRFLFILLVLAPGLAMGQKIYGFAGKYFGGYDVQTLETDTLFTLDDYTWIEIGFSAAIDPFNGRYFKGGEIPGWDGNFHIIDLHNRSVQSVHVSHRPTGIEYDFLKDRLLFISRGRLFALYLQSLSVVKLGNVEDGGVHAWGSARVFNPHTNEYWYVVYIDPPDEPFYIVVDASDAREKCRTTVEPFQLGHYHPTDLSADMSTGRIFGHRNGLYGIADPCNGTLTRIRQIPDYYGRLNVQMSVLDNRSLTYIVPYASHNPNHPYRLAFIDVVRDSILLRVDQPWHGTMNVQQIYDRPPAPLIYLRDTLFVPKGQEYRWFRNGVFECATRDNWYVPTVSGTYSARVVFRDYTSSSDTVAIVVAPEPELELAVFPSPATDLLHVRFTHASSFDFSLLDITGRLVLQRRDCNASQVTLSVDNLPPGSYVACVRRDQDTYCRVFIKI